MPNYNGVELPALPVWDKTAYPYAIIAELEIGYVFEVRNVPLTFTNPNYSAPAGHNYKNWILMDGAWTEGGTVDNSPTSASYSPDEVIWTNTDIKDSAGTVYMAASEPEVTKWTGLKSWLTGLIANL